MRKKIIGKKVHVKIDYMRQATEATADQKGFPERACATVTFQGMSHKLLRHQKLLRHHKITF